MVLRVGNSKHLDSSTDAPKNIAQQPEDTTIHHTDSDSNTKNARKAQLTPWQTALAIGAGVVAAIIGKNLIAEKLAANSHVTKTFSDGSTYEGSWLDGRENGPGTLSLPNGHRYQGNWVDGIQEGTGIYTWPNGAQYSGTWVNGKREGLGTLISPEGHIYQGSWINGIHNGQGTLISPDGKPYQGQATYSWPDGTKYEGNWVDGKEHGEGIQILPDGTKYQGNWVNGKKEGHGTLIFPDGDTYKGSWVNGKKHGHGTYTWSDGGRYVGNWANDKKHGHGTLIQPDGAELIVNWVNGQAEGSGTMSTPDGTRLEGTWANNKRKGSGLFIFHDGSKYEVNYLNGYRQGNGIYIRPDGSKYEGQATLTLPDGSKYTGNWAKGKKHGQGIYTWPNGVQYEGEWINGDILESRGTLTSPDGSRYKGPWPFNKYQSGSFTYTWPDGTQIQRDNRFAENYLARITLRLPDGKKYQSSLIFKPPDVKGNLDSPDGIKYEGTWKLNLLSDDETLSSLDGSKYEGQASVTLPDGTKYEGSWVNGRKHGQGTYTRPDGSQYIGSWVNSQRHGQGTYTWPDGSQYIGSWVNGQKHGQGTHTWPDGSQYIGSWVNDQRNGQGTYTHSDGTKHEGSWVNSLQVAVNLSKLGDLKFQGLLTGTLSSSSNAYNLGIISEFLRAENDPAYHQLAKALATETSNEERDVLAQRILNNLNSQEHAELLTYGYTTHGMGLRIQPTEDRNDFYFDIFNSGAGLEKYHPSITLKPGGHQLYQTMLRVKVPRAQVTQKRLIKLLGHSDFKNSDESYGAILNIPGAQKIALNDFQAVWQQAQKSDNCALEWIFAVLRNSMGLRHYTQFRKKIYQAALDRSINPNSATPGSHIRVRETKSYREPAVNELPAHQAIAQIRGELKRKLHKSLDLSAQSPNDQTGAFLSRQDSILYAQKLISEPDKTSIMRGLNIFSKLPEGEGLSEVMAASEPLLTHPDPIIRAKSRRLLERIAPHIIRELRQ